MQKNRLFLHYYYMIRNSKGVASNPYRGKGDASAATRMRKIAHFFINMIYFETSKMQRVSPLGIFIHQIQNLIFHQSVPLSTLLSITFLLCQTTSIS